MNHLPLIMSAIGPKNSGRTTAMHTLTECLWEAGYKRLLGLEDVAPDFDKVYQSRVTSVLQPVPTTIILVARIDDEQKWAYLKETYGDRFLVLRVSRTHYDDPGNKVHTKLRYDPSPEEKWIYKANADFSITNNNTLKVFCWQVNQLFLDTIEPKIKRILCQ